MWPANTWQVNIYTNLTPLLERNRQSLSSLLAQSTRIPECVQVLSTQGTTLSTILSTPSKPLKKGNWAPFSFSSSLPPFVLFSLSLFKNRGSLCSPG